MVNNRAVACVLLVLMAIFGQMGCKDSQQSKGKGENASNPAHKSEGADKVGVDSGQDRPAPASGTSASAMRVPLGEIKVAEGTPDGEWLEVGGHTPLLWCYRGGKRLVFEQAGPKVYLSIDGKPFFLAGIIVRSKEEMLLVDGLSEKEADPLTLWVYSPHLKHMKDLTDTKSITSVQVWEWGRGILTDLSLLTRARDLTSLCVRDCPKLVDLSPLKGLATLSSLDTCRTGVSDVSGIVGLQLVWLDIRSTKLTPTKAASLADFKQIATLKVNAYAADDVAMPLAAVLPKLPNLEILTVQCSEKADGEGGALVPIGMPPKLLSLNLDGLGRKPDFSMIASLKNLTSLRVTAIMKQLEMDLTPLSQLTSLRSLRLEVRNGRTLEEAEASDNLFEESSLDLVPVQKLKALESLDVTCEAQTASHESLGALPALQELRIRSYGEITIPEFRRPEGLRVLEFVSPVSGQRAFGLKNLDRIGRLTNLERLTVRGCSLERKPGEDQDLKPLASLRKLRVLDLADCDVNVEGLESLKQLEVLNLRNWHGFKTLWVQGKTQPDTIDLLPLLAGLESLRELDLSRKAPTIPFDLTPLGKLRKLERIELDQTEVKGGSLPFWPSLRSASLPPNITSEGLAEFASKHRQVARLRLRGGNAGGNTMFYVPLKADLSPLRKLTQLTELELECDNLSLVGDMPLLTKVLIWPKPESWGVGLDLDLDIASARNLAALRYLEIGGTYWTLRLPAWQNVFEVRMWTLLALHEQSGSVVGLPWERGARLFPPSLRPANEANATGPGPSTQGTDRSP